MKQTDLVKEWLLSEGYKYTIDKDGDLQFKYQGRSILVSDDANDPLFLRIILPCIYQVTDNRGKVLEVLNKLNSKIKAVKGFLIGDYVWLSIETFMDSSPEPEDFIERCLDILILGQDKFATELYRP